MIAWLESIAQFLVSIAQLVYNTVTSIIWVVTSIPQFVGSITAVFGYAPSYLLVFLEISLALTILFAIIKLL